MSFIIDDETFSNQPKEDLNPITTEDPLKVIQADDWNELIDALTDIKTFLRGGVKLYKASDTTKHCDLVVVTANPDSSVTAEKGSLAVDVTNAKLYQNTNGSTGWDEVGTGGGSSGVLFDQDNVGSPLSFPTTAQYDNVDPGTLGFNTWVPATVGVATNGAITGFQNGSDGKIMAFFPDHNIRLVNEHSGSTAGNRIQTPGATDYSCIANAAVWLRYAGGSVNRWQFATSNLT